jgi:hypothetical protein
LAPTDAIIRDVSNQFAVLHVDDVDQDAAILAARLVRDRESSRLNLAQNFAS